MTRRATDAVVGQRITGFAPLATADARVLVLGSMPSVASLERRQYYGLPRNAFWPIMTELFGVGADRPYDERVAALLQHHVAVWDVFASCTRPGSLDAAIDRHSAVVNDFAEFFRSHAHIRHVFCNGKMAGSTYAKRVLPTLRSDIADLPRTVLPSTSPAHAAMSFDEKLMYWRALRRAADAD